MKTADNAPLPSAANWLKKRSKKVRSLVGISVFLGVLSGLLIIAQAHYIAAIIHSAFMDGRTLSQIQPDFIALAVVIIVRSATAWAREWSGFATGAAVRGKVRLDLLKHLSGLGPVTTARLSSGSLVSTAMEQVEALQNYFAYYLPQIFIAVLVPGMVAAFVFPLSWAAGAILLTTAPLIPLFMFLVGMGAESVSQKHFQALARMSGHFLDTLQGLTTLKIFDRSKAELKNIARVSNEYRRKTMAVLRVAFLSSAVLEFFSAIAIAIVAVYLGLGYLRYHEFGSYGSSLTFQQGFFILLLAPEFYAPLKELGAHYHARASAVGATEEILKILNLDTGQSAGDTEGIVLKEATTLGIEFKEVCMDYNRGAKALDNVSFSIKAGAKIAVVGPSGAGKSTLIHLLLGFVQPTEGQIQINGTALCDLAMKNWRRQLAWIGQNPILFPGSIAENIQVADPDAGYEAIKRAALAAGVTLFSDRLPRGLDTILGEKGVGLSQGQIQRVALARAYLKKAPVLLLDEPTAGLDQTTERQLIRQTISLFKDRTVLMVTHSQAALSGMDTIVHLDQGRLIRITSNS